jgi:hypothetical protein
MMIVAPPALKSDLCGSAVLLPVQPPPALLRSATIRLPSQ